LVPEGVSQKKRSQPSIHGKLGESHPKAENGSFGISKERKSNTAHEGKAANENAGERSNLGEIPKIWARRDRQKEKKGRMKLRDIAELHTNALSVSRRRPGKCSRKKLRIKKYGT